MGISLQTGNTHTPVQSTEHNEIYYATVKIKTVEFRAFRRLSFARVIITLLYDVRSTASSGIRGRNSRQLETRQNKRRLYYSKGN